MIDAFQRNFLLRSFDLSTEQMPKAVDITTFYTKISSKETLKFQSVDEKYFLITNDTREEISRKDFEKAKEKALLKILFKKSYVFLSEEQTAFLQIYEKEKWIVLKIFFKSEDEALRFELNAKMQPLRELDKSFNSKNFILYDDIKTIFDLDACFKIIKKNQNFNLNFPNSLNANDGFRVLLFYLLYQFKSQIKKRDSRKNLHFTILKICIFLNDVKELFDVMMVQKLLNDFKKLEKKLKQNRLNLKPYRNLLYDFEFFLREGEFFKNVEKELFLKSFVAQKLQMKFILFKKFFYQKFSYEEFMKQCLELRIFLKYFAHFFADKNLQKLALIFDENNFAKFVKKREKIVKLIQKTNKNLKIYKGS